LRLALTIVVTKCQILRLKCTKFDFVWGAAPDSAGELTALPRPSSWIEGETGQGMGGEERRRGVEEKGDLLQGLRE